MIDEKIGEILSALEEKGYLDNTVVIFTSDHGDCLGDHGHIQKWTMYDCITRTPLIVWSPNRFPGGRRIHHLVQQFDIAPALMELAEVDVPEDWEARTILPLLRGDPVKSHREHVFAEQRQDSINSVVTKTEFITMVRSRDFKLVHYLGDDDFGELYDLKNDPGEHRNLWFEPNYREKREAMLRVLLNWRIRSDAITADWAMPWR
jgi:arylsulfatase A-like enzyme